MAAPAYAVIGRATEDMPGRLKPRGLYELRYLQPYLSVWQFFSPDDQQLILSRFQTFYVAAKRGWHSAAKHAQDPEGHAIFGSLPNPSPGFIAQQQ